MPVEEKNTSGAWVLATKILVTKSSSRVAMPERPAPAAALHAIFGQRRALDVAGMGDGDRHVLALDQILVFEFEIGLDQFGLARGGEFVADFRQFVAHDGKHARARAQDVEIVLDRHGQLLHLVGDFVAAQRGQPLQAQIEDRLGLFLGQPDRALAA